MAEGFHIYGRPLPEGFIASEITIPASAPVRTGPTVYPPTHRREFPELDVTLNVYEGTVDIAIPVTVQTELLNWPNPDKPTSVDIPIEILYQACSETVCYTPRTEELVVHVPIESLVMPGGSRR